MQPVSQITIAAAADYRGDYAAGKTMVLRHHY
jgi:hypothetical protein